MFFALTTCGVFELGGENGDGATVVAAGHEHGYAHGFVIMPMVARVRTFAHRCAHLRTHAHHYTH